MFDILLRDLRYALRVARKSWMFTATVVLTLALCIGVNTAIFSVVDAALLRPLPYPRPDRLTQVVLTVRGEGIQGQRTAHTGRTWERVRDGAPLLDAAVYGGGGGVNLSAGQNASVVQQQRVSAGFFRVLGVPPALGREFTTEEDRVGGPPVVVLSHGLWRKFFQEDPSIVGRAVMLRGEPYTVVGVMPAGFRSNFRADIWTPLRPSTSGEGSGQNYTIIARLRDNAAWEQAKSQLQSASQDLARERWMRPGTVAYLDVVDLQTGLAQGIRQPLVILWAAVAVVLLIGCVNVGGMLLARGSGRASEIATRLALGAERSAIIRQLLTEGVVLAVAGGVAGLAVGYAALAGLQRVGQDMFPVLETASLDGRIVAITAGLSLLTSLLFGLFPALAASRTDVRTAQGGGRGVAGRTRFISLGLLVSGQVTLAVPLLIGAGLLARTFVRLWSLDPGFDPSSVVTATFSLQDARYKTSQRTNQLFDDTLRQIAELPGIDAAAFALSLPYQRGLNMPLEAPNARTTITNMTYVTPGYFKALGIRLFQGRLFQDSDGPSAARVAIVNDAFVKMYLPNQEPVGQLVRMRRDYTGQIVGVVSSIQQRPGWGDFGPLAPVPTVYVPAAQTSDGFLQLVHTWFSPSLIVKSGLPERDVVSAVQRIIRSVDPLLPIASFRSVEDVKLGSLGLQRFLAALLAVISGLALVLSTLGIYGLIANSVAERTRELGIRMALGSTVNRAVVTATFAGVTWALAGVTVGAVLAIFTERLLKGFLWGVSPSDPMTFGGVAFVLVLAALVASLGPALRVARLNPAQTLRDE